MRFARRVRLLWQFGSSSDIAQEPNLSTSRLSLLIDSLASGADVFSASSQPDGSQINEMELVVGST